MNEQTQEALKMAIEAMKWLRMRSPIIYEELEAEKACKEALSQETPATDWQGLSNDDINELLEETPYVEYGSWIEFAKDIEQAIKDKNTKEKQNDSE